MLDKAALQDAILAECNCSGASFREADLTGCDLRLAIFDAADLCRSLLVSADMEGMSIRRANLSNSDLAGTNFHMIAKNAVMCNLSATTLRAYELSGIDFERADLSRVDLSHATLVDCKLTRVNLRQANLSHCVMRNVDLHHATMTNCKCDHMTLESCNLSFATVDDSTMNSSKLDNCILDAAVLHRVQMLDVETSECSFKGVDFSLSDLTRSQFEKGAFQDTCFDSGTLFNCNFRGALLGRSRCSKANLQGCLLEDADLRGCKWISSSLRLCKMRGVQAGGADLSHSDLQQADVQGVVWHLGAAFHGGAATDDAIQRQPSTSSSGSLQRRKSGVESGGVTLHGCKLTTVNMSGADLRHSDLSHANMVNAILVGAIWDNTDLSHAVLTGAKVDSLKGCLLLGTKLEAVVLTECDLLEVPEVEAADRNMRMAQLQRAKAAARILRGFVLDRYLGMLALTLALFAPLRSSWSSCLSLALCAMLLTSHIISLTRVRDYARNGWLSGCDSAGAVPGHSCLRSICAGPRWTTASCATRT